MYKCRVCGKKFKGKQRSKANKYCSKPCQALGSRKRVDKICKICGVKYEVPVCRKFTSSYCSKKCHDRGEINQRENTCLNCGKIFNSDFSRPRKFCSRECRYSYWIGENSPSWLGGKSYEPYSVDFNTTLKNSIKIRDNYKCQICGVPERECLIGLNIHHIDYNKKNSTMNNLVALCHRCHLKTNTKRDYWRNYFNKRSKKMGSTKIESPSPAPQPSNWRHR